MGGILQLLPGSSNSDQDAPPVKGIADSCDHLPRFKAINRFRDGRRPQVHASRQFSNRDSLSIGRQQIQCHKLRSAQARSVEPVEIRCLNDLPDSKPCIEEPGHLGAPFLSLHPAIVLQEVLPRVIE